MQERLNADKHFRLFELLLQARDTVHRAARRELQEAAGISIIEAELLLFAQILGSRATNAELARWLFREPHSVSTLVSRMEEKGLVRRVKDLDKKNLVRVEVTEKGRQTDGLIEKRATIDHIMYSLSPEEHRQLGSLLEKLINRATEELGIERPPWPLLFR